MFSRVGRDLNFPVLAFLSFAFAALSILTACSPSAGETSSPDSEKSIVIAHSDWDESEATALLTRTILEDEFGYDVKLEETTPETAFDMVAGGDADAFQGIWRPRHDDLVAEYEDDIVMLGGWLFGTTRASLAVPSYMDTQTLSDLEEADTERALALEPEASGVGEAPAETFEENDLEPSIYSDVSAMMEEVERLYENEEPFVMVAYSPHWMNLEYELVYLEGGGLLENINRPQTLHSAANPSFADEDPLGRALLAEISLTENQAESLELDIRNAETPGDGARLWVESNSGLVRLWVHNARESVS